MIRTIIILALTSILLFTFGCVGNSGSSNTKEDSPSILTTLEIIPNKSEISADNTDKVVFTINAYDQNNKSITSNAIIYLDGSQISGNEFKTNKSGSYNFVAKSGVVSSKIVNITATSFVVEGKLADRKESVINTTISGVSYSSTLSMKGSPFLGGFINSLVLYSPTINSPKQYVLEDISLIILTSIKSIINNKINHSFSILIYADTYHSFLISENLASFRINDALCDLKVETKIDDTSSSSNFVTSSGFTTLYETSVKKCEFYDILKKNDKDTELRIYTKKGNIDMIVPKEFFIWQNEL